MASAAGGRTDTAQPDCLDDFRRRGRFGAGRCAAVGAARGAGGVDCARCTIAAAVHRPRQCRAARRVWTRPAPGGRQHTDNGTVAPRAVMAGTDRADGRADRRCGRSAAAGRRVGAELRPPSAGRPAADQRPRPEGPAAQRGDREAQQRFLSRHFRARRRPGADRWTRSRRPRSSLTGADRHGRAGPGASPRCRCRRRSTSRACCTRR